MKIYKKLKPILPYAFFLLFSILTIFIQIKHRAVLISGDTLFHWNRFYDISEQLTSGDFNYFQMNYGFNQSGRIINAVYGPLFALINGIVVFFCKNWFIYQILSDIALLLTADIGMYLLAKKLKADNLTATLIALIFSNIGSVQTWIDESNFNAWGAALVPFALICVVDMFEDKNNPIHWIKLMLVISIISQVHILTTLLISVALVPLFCISFIHSTAKKQMLVNLLKAICGTLILTANVWGSLLLLHSDNLSLPSRRELLAYSLHLSTIRSVRFGITFVLIVVFSLQLLYVVTHFKQSILNTSCTIIGYFVLIISSSLIPWEKIQAYFPVLGRAFQFPFRLTILAYPLLLMGICISLKNLKFFRYKKLVTSILLIMVFLYNFVPNIIVNKNLTQKYLTNNQVVSSRYFTYITNDKEKIRNAVHSNNKKAVLELVDNYQPDYLPLSHNLSDNQTVAFYKQEIVQKESKFEHIVLKNGSLKLRWKAKRNAKVQIPLIMYKPSKLIINGKTEIVNKTPIGAPIVQQHVGKNTVILSFTQPAWFIGMISICIVTWIILIIYGMYKFFNILRK